MSTQTAQYFDFLDMWNISDLANATLKPVVI